MTLPQDITPPPQSTSKPYLTLFFATMLLLVPQPLFLFYVFCCPQFSNFSQRTANGSLWALGITLWWFIIWTKAVWELLKDMFRSKTAKTVAIVAAFFFNGLLLGVLAIQRKKPLAMVFAACAFLLSCFSVLGHFQRFQWILPHYTAIGIASLLCVGCAIIILNGGFSRQFAYALIPLLVCIVLHAALHVRKHLIQKECNQIKARISTMVDGYPTETADYRRLVESGSSVEEEPLKSLISSMEPIKSDAFAEVAAPLSEVKEKYALFTEKHTDFVAAVRATAENSPQHVAHVWNDDIYSTLLPDLSAFRKASQFLSMEIKANATDRKLVANNNHALIRLRDCTLENAFLISRLVGIAIEALRIDALTFTLPYSKYTLEEFEALLGEPPNWNLRIAQSLLDEAIAHDHTKDYLLKNPYSLDSLGGGEGTTKAFHLGGFFYSAFSNLLDYDVLLGWQFAEREIGFALAEKRSYPELEELENKSTDKMKRSGAYLCLMLWPSTLKVLRKMDAIMDLRRMAVLAWRVVDYRNAHNGTLPESLDALGEVPVDSVKRLPFEYRHGDLEFKKAYEDKIIRFSGFRIAHANPDAEDSNLWVDPSVCVPLE